MHSHDHGLAHDLETILKTASNRRQALRWLASGAAAALPLIGCGGGGGDSTTTASTGTSSSTGSSSTTTGTSTSTASASTASTTASCSTIPEETAGPYPADGSNTLNGSTINALLLSGIVRSDIRASIAGATGVADGVPLTVKLQLVNTNSSCASLAGLAVYLWHCDRNGNYSLYSSGLTGENYLRGVQETDSSGMLTFTTIFPGCYSGRVPHIHFEVYPSLAKATSSSNKIKTSQLSFPNSVSTDAYTATGYSSSVTNLSRISFATDNVFSDGTSLQMATVTGSVSAGFVATLTVGVTV
ncbi:MAG TPA: intradiol ring-cleavage dioxygenase [Noviherbaspirillum sp.]|nr:intradiol ring-cleavage dioxygenase [Noviherbaspirillum sp.]